MARVKKASPPVFRLVKSTDARRAVEVGFAGGEHAGDFHPRGVHVRAESSRWSNDGDAPDLHGGKIGRAVKGGTRQREAFFKNTFGKIHCAGEAAFDEAGFVAHLGVAQIERIEDDGVFDGNAVAMDVGPALGQQRFEKGGAQHAIGFIRELAAKIGGFPSEDLARAQISPRPGASANPTGVSSGTGPNRSRGSSATPLISATIWKNWPESMQRNTRHADAKALARLLRVSKDASVFSASRYNSP